MGLNGRIKLIALIILVIGISSYYFLPRENHETNKEGTLKIGAGDDITGLLLKRIIELNKAEQRSNFLSIENKDEEVNNLLSVKEDLELYTFKDC